MGEPRSCCSCAIHMADKQYKLGRQIEELMPSWDVLPISKRSVSRMLADQIQTAMRKVVSLNNLIGEDNELIGLVGEDKTKSSIFATTLTVCWRKSSLKYQVMTTRSLSSATDLTVLSLSLWLSVPSSLRQLVLVFTRLRSVSSAR